MIVFLAGGALFAVLGFGLGLLCRENVNSEDHGPVSITLDAEIAIQAWSTVYTQAAETIRDTVKLLAGANLAGLAACVAVITNSGIKTPSTSGYLYLSTLSFLFGLICTVIPNAGLSEKYRDDADAIASSLLPIPRKHVPLPHSWPTGLKRYMPLLALLSITIGILLFAIHLFHIGAVEVIVNDVENLYRRVSN